LARFHGVDAPISGCFPYAADIPTDARWSVRTQSAPASIGGNVCRIWKAAADGRVYSVETYQSSPNIFFDILDMKGIMQTPVTWFSTDALDRRVSTRLVYVPHSSASFKRILGLYEQISLIISTFK